MSKSDSSHDDITLADGASLFDACESIAARLDLSRVTLNYAKLKERLDSIRREAKWPPATLTAILLSVDPQSEGQSRFQSMLRHAGFDPDIVHFRDAFVSLPPGRSPSEMTMKSTVSLAARLSYIAGLMAGHPLAHFMVVSHSYELHAPLLDLAGRLPKGKVGLAYFGSLLDYRWRSSGIFDKNLGFRFFDLDEHSDELLGVNLVMRKDDSASVPSVLGRI